MDTDANVNANTNANNFDPAIDPVVILPDGSEWIVSYMHNDTDVEIDEPLRKRTNKRRDRELLVVEGTRAVKLNNNNNKINNVPPPPYDLSKYCTPIDTHCDEEFGNLPLIGKDIPVIFSKNADGKNVAKGKKFAFIWTDDISPKVTQDVIKSIVQKAEFLHAELAEDFPKLVTSKVTQLHLSGNATHVVVPPGIGALASADVLVMPEGVLLNFAKGEPGIVKLIAHEVGHCFFGPWYAFDRTWGNGCGELYAEFSANYLFPRDGNVYNVAGSLVKNNHNLNLFSFESLFYKTKPMRCYNATFWVWFCSRFGKAKFEQMLRDRTMTWGGSQIDSFWTLCARYLQITERELGIMWATDLVTAGLFRDGGVRWKAACKLLGGTLYTKANMIWKPVHNNLFTVTGTGSNAVTARNTAKTLEAFGFIAVNFEDLVGGNGTWKIKVSADDATLAANDPKAWAITIVSAKGDATFDIKYTLGNETTVACVGTPGTKGPGPRTVVILMHTHNMKGNSSADSAINFTIAATRA